MIRQSELYLFIQCVTKKEQKEKDQTPPSMKPLAALNTWPVALKTCILMMTAILDSGTAK